MLSGGISFSLQWLLGNNFPHLVSPRPTRTTARSCSQLVQVGALCCFQAAVIFACVSCSACELSLGKGHPEPTLCRLLFLQLQPSTFLDNCLGYGTLSWPGEVTEPGETRAACDPQTGQRCPMLLLCSPSNCPHTSAASPTCAAFQNVPSQSRAVLGLCSAERGPRQGPSCGAPGGITIGCPGDTSPPRAMLYLGE